MSQHGRAVVFCRTWRGADRVAKQLNPGGGSRPWPSTGIEPRPSASGPWPPSPRDGPTRRWPPTWPPAASTSRTCPAWCIRPADRRHRLPPPVGAQRGGRDARGTVVSFVTDTDHATVRGMQRALGLAQGFDAPDGPSTATVTTALSAPESGTATKQAPPRGGGTKQAPPRGGATKQAPRRGGAKRATQTAGAARRHGRSGAPQERPRPVLRLGAERQRIERIERVDAAAQVGGTGAQGSSAGPAGQLSAATRSIGVCAESLRVPSERCCWQEGSTASPSIRRRAWRRWSIGRIGCAAPFSLPARSFSAYSSCTPCGARGRGRRENGNRATTTRRCSARLEHGHVGLGRRRPHHLGDVPPRSPHERPQVGV